jgi:AraC-like DNA-binding protein
MMHASSFCRKVTPAFTKDKASAESFLLSGDLQKAELSILPLRKSSVLRDQDDIRRFQVKSILESRTGRSADEAGAQASDLSLSIHSQFLENVGVHPSSRQKTDTVYISDIPIAELAHGLLREESRDELSRNARFCAVVMLCDRVAGLLARSHTTSLNRLQEWQISALDDVLSSSMGEDASVENLAALCRLSMCHFSRLFKATYGKPFHKYLIQARIERAQIQLTDSEDAISQVALDCGFADQSCFTRRFSTAVGMPPASWRKHTKRARTAVVSQSFMVQVGAAGSSAA